MHPFKGSAASISLLNLQCLDRCLGFEMNHLKIIYTCENAVEPMLCPFRGLGMPGHLRSGVGVRECSRRAADGGLFV